jgi:hypothetical protein
VLTAAFRPEALTWFFFYLRLAKPEEGGGEKEKREPSSRSSSGGSIIYFGVVLQEEVVGWLVGTVPHGHQLRSARDTVRSAFYSLHPI